jgi:hypothetical protein
MIISEHSHLFPLVSQRLWNMRYLSLIIKSESFKVSWAPVVHTCNSSYSGGKDQENCSVKPAQENSLREPISKQPFPKRVDGVAQGVGSEFKPQNHTHTHTHTHTHKVLNSDPFATSVMTPLCAWTLLVNNVCKYIKYTGLQRNSVVFEYSYFNIILFFFLSTWVWTQGFELEPCFQPFLLWLFRK